MSFCSTRYQLAPGVVDTLLNCALNNSQSNTLVVAREKVSNIDSSQKSKVKTQSSQAKSKKNNSAKKAKVKPEKPLF